MKRVSLYNLPGMMGSHIAFQLNNLPTAYFPLQLVKHQQ